MQYINVQQFYVHKNFLHRIGDKSVKPNFFATNLYLKPINYCLNISKIRN